MMYPERDSPLWRTAWSALVATGREPDAGWMLMHVEHAAVPVRRQVRQQKRNDLAQRGPVVRIVQRQPAERHGNGVGGFVHPVLRVVARIPVVVGDDAGRFHAVVQIPGEIGIDGNQFPHGPAAPEQISKKHPIGLHVGFVV